jgi:hypothetical protein
MKLVSTAAALGLVATAAIGLAAPASAASHRPDTACQKAGMNTLRSLGLLDDVARGGLPISLATDPSVGVTVRPGADISGLPDPIPLKVVLADHRAGDHSLLIYPWC